MPLKLLAEGKVANVPIIFGTNKDEGTMFCQCPTTLPDSEYQAFLNEQYAVFSPFPASFLLANRVYESWPECVVNSFVITRYGAVLGPLVAAQYPLTAYPSPSGYWAASHAWGDAYVRHTFAPLLLLKACISCDLCALRRCHALLCNPRKPSLQAVRT